MKCCENDCTAPGEASIWHTFHPLRAHFFSGDKSIYLHFMSFLHIDMTQVVEILPQVRQGPAHSA